MSDRVSTDTPTEQILPTETTVAMCERNTVKSCANCNGPVLNASGVCGACEPSKAGIRQMLKAAGHTDGRGRNGKRESGVGVVELFDHLDNAAPAHKAIAMWSIDPEIAAVMASEVSDLMHSRRSITERFWPNPEDTHVNYRGRTVGGIA